MSLYANSLSRYAALLVLAASTQLCANKAYAQSGVAPSQTGLFFDDLRNRANNFGSNAATDESARTSSSGVYDYEQGEYSGESVEERELGERPVIGDEVTRGLGSPTYRSGYTGSTKRSSADYTSSGSAYASSNTFFAPTYITDPFLAGKRNIKAGPVNIGLGLSANVEYNDNITRSNQNKIDDMIAGVYLNVDANYAITQNNRISLAMGVGVDHYFNHPELSPNGDEFTLNVLPGSTVSFDVKIGDIFLVFYDRVSVRSASQDDFALDNNDLFGAFQNDVGAGMSWAINSKLNLSINVNRSDSWALEDYYDQYDRSITSISGSLAWTPTGTFTIGLESSFSWVDYKENFNNDGTTFTAGVFFSMPISTTTFVKASAGIQEFNFDAPPETPSLTATDNDILNTQYLLSIVNAQLAYASTQALRQQQAYLQDLLASQRIQQQSGKNLSGNSTYDNSDLTDYYYNVTLFNQLNARISHQLSFGHESSLNTTSNYITADYITYGMGIIAWNGSRISLSGYYERSEESGGFLAENTDQWGLDAFFSQRLTSTLTLGVGYHYGNIDSNISNRSYEQHSFSVDFNYAVNTKMTLGLGYRYWTTAAEDETQDFDQNRVIMSANYNF